MYDSYVYHQKHAKITKLITRSTTNGSTPAVQLSIRKEENDFTTRIASLPFLGGVVFTTGMVKPVQNEHFQNNNLKNYRPRWRYHMRQFNAVPQHPL